MFDAKVVESIRSLSSEEQDELAQFLLSPYFQKGFSVIELTTFYDLILQGLKSAETPFLDREVIYSRIFQGKPYNQGRMDRLMFELNRLIRVFLTTKHYLREDNTVQQTLDWLTVQRVRNLGTNIEKQLEKVKSEVSDKASVNRFLERYQIAWAEHEWYSAYNKAKGDLGVPDVIEFLDLFYFSQRIELLNRFFLQQRLTPMAMPEVIRQGDAVFNVPEYYLKKSLVLDIKHKIQELLRQPEPEVRGFQELMEVLQTHGHEFPNELLAEFYSYLRNFCTFLIDAGYTNYDQVLHELQKDNLQRGYFYFEGKIHPNAVLSITQHAIRAKNLKWARTFVETHKDKIIGENETADFYRMNLALCLFAEQQYDAALEVIPFGSTYSAYHQMARRLELKIYYELNSDLLPSKIDAYKMFVSRAGHKLLSPSVSELLTNFGNFVHQLSMSVPGDKKRSAQLIKRIESKKRVGERSWLLEKARELGEIPKKR